MATLNPGIAELLSSHDGLTTVKNSTFNPYSDYAFTGTDKTISFPARGLRISVYCADWSQASGLKIHAQHQFTGNVRKFNVTFGNGDVSYTDVTNNTTKTITSNLSNGFHDFAINAIPTTVYFEIDGRIYSYGTGITSSVNITTYTGLYFPTADEGTFYVSNLMADNRQIYSTEKVYSIPLYKTGGNMTEEDGFHIASNANDSLQMEVNYSVPLADKVGGGKVRVTNVMLVGNPAYRVGDTLTKLSAAYKEYHSTVSSAMGTATLQTNQDGVCTFTKALSGVVFYDSNVDSSFANSQFIFTAS